MSTSLSAEAVAPEGDRQLVLDCFTITASADPGVMPRVIELYAKRGLVPALWHSRLGGANQDELMIDIQVGGLSDGEVRHIAACLRQVPCVGGVLTYVRAGMGER